MSLPRFYIERPRPGKPSLILMGFRYNHTGIRMSTKERCVPEHWDKDKQRVADKWCQRYPDYLEVNRMLDEMSQFTRRTYNEHRRDRRLHQLNPERLKKLVKQFRDGEVVDNDRVLIVDYYRKFVDRRIRSGSFAPATIAQDLAGLRHFENFVKEYKTPIYFDQYCLDIVLAYRSHFWDADNPNCDNTTEKYMRKFKSVCKDAYINRIEIPINPGEINSKEHLRLSKEPRDTIALYLPELDHLKALDLSGTPSTAITRDLFLLGCFTGLRYNRWSQIGKENIVESDGVESLDLFTTKGKNKRVNIPLHPMVKVICEQYDWQLPEVPTLNVINLDLKEIGKQAGFTEDVQRAQWVRGRSVLTTEPKWKLISTHTARRSFATNAYEAGVPIEDISALVGHGDIDTTRHYIKLDLAAKSKRLAALPFFNN